MFYVISAIVFALAFSIKGGLLGRIFKNWQRVVNKLEKDFSFAIENWKIAWHNDDLFHSDGLLIATGKLFLAGFLKWFVDGSVISWFIVGIFAHFTLSWEQAALFTVAYALIFQSMGEEAGAVGDYKEAWGDYMDFPDNFGRAYGIKKAFQYGAVLGGATALATASWTMFIAGALMPVCYFAGNSLYRFIKGGDKRGWSYSEPKWGLVFGIAYAASFRYLLVW